MFYVFSICVFVFYVFTIVFFDLKITICVFVFHVFTFVFFELKSPNWSPVELMLQLWVISFHSMCRNLLLLLLLLQTKKTNKQTNYRVCRTLQLLPLSDCCDCEVLALGWEKLSKVSQSRSRETKAVNYCEIPDHLHGQLTVLVVPTICKPILPLSRWHLYK